jgi:hypothetical protein
MWAPPLPDVKHELPDMTMMLVLKVITDIAFFHVSHNVHS